MTRGAVGASRTMWDILAPAGRSDSAPTAAVTWAVGFADRIYRGGFAATQPSPFESSVTSRCS